jgi:hypothetical protein
VTIVKVEAVFFSVLALLFLGMIAMQIAGHRYGLRRGSDELCGSSEGTAAVEAALYALLGLFVAFTFSGASDRLEARRQLIVEESNAIGTAYLRLDLLPAADQPRIRDEMRRYLESRLTFYDRLLDFRGASAEREHADQLQQQIWNHALGAAGRAPDTRATLLVLPSLNAMFDAASKRYAALRMHLPVAIFIQLLLIALVCGFFAGIGMSKRKRPSYLHMVMFAGVIAVTAYVILNLEYPRVGFGRLRALDIILREQLAAMK